MLKMTLTKGNFAVCRLSNSEAIPSWSMQKGFFSITRTSEELSVVCPEEAVPMDIQCEKHWRMLKVEGPLDFSLIGILSSISTVLAQKEISIFAISTYDTDYILIKSKDIDGAIRALRESDMEVTE